jgi:hypothetical protein
MNGRDASGAAAALAVFAATLQFSGCASFGPATLKPGDGVDIARQKLGAPSAEHRRAARSGSRPTCSTSMPRAA